MIASFRCRETQYRFCFRWRNGNAHEAEIVDYHPEEKAAMPEGTDPVHPGEILLKEFLRPAGLSVSALSVALRVPATRISAIVHGQRAITADTAMRLGRYFSTTSEFWMNLQRDYELRVAAAESLRLIQQEVQPRSAA